MITRDDLEVMTSSDLHDRAIDTAKVERDLDWLRHLLRSIPAAEQEIGDLEDSGMDMAGTVSAVNGYIRADRDLPDALRSQYVDYLLGLGPMLLGHRPAVVVRESQLDPDRLVALVTGLLTDRAQLGRMTKAAKAAGKRDAAETLAREITVLGGCA